MSELELTQGYEKVLGELQLLQESMQRLETWSAINALPNTSLFSEKFLTRAFAVLGHDFVAGLIIAVPIYALMFVLALAAASRF